MSETAKRTGVLSDVEATNESSNGVAGGHPVLVPGGLALHAMTLCLCGHDEFDHDEDSECEGDVGMCHCMQFRPFNEDTEEDDETRR